MRVWLVTAAVVMTVVSAAAAGPIDAPLSRQGVRDNQRCTALAMQFERAAAQRNVAQAAKNQAAQGEDQCRAGHFGEGIASLEKAVEMIGETPGK